MTIETATPSSAETIAAMFDTLVDAVAARVLAQLDERVNSKIEDFCSEQLDSKIDEWASNFLQDRVYEHVDLEDQVLETVQNLSFDVSVSR